MTGVFVLPSPGMLISGESGPAVAAVATYLCELEQAAAEMGQQFLNRLRGDGLDGAWHLEHGAAAFNIARRARPTDLVVLGQHDRGLVTVLPRPEDVVLSCGLPVIVVPFAGRFDSVSKNAAIAWNGSRESARAVHDALPLLMPQKKVTVVSINPGSDAEDIRGDLVRHLAREGFDAKAETHVTKLTPAELMLSRIPDNGNDLVIMGNTVTRACARRYWAG